MLSTKQTGAKVFRRKYRRDSGIYSDSGPSEVELPLKCHDDSPEISQQEENHRDNMCSSESTLSRGVAGKAECSVTDFYQEYKDPESLEVEFEGICKNIVKKQVDADTNLQNGEYSDSSKDQTCLLKLYGQDCDSQNQKDAMQKCNPETLNYNPETVNSYKVQDENLDYGGLQKSHTYESIDSLGRPSLVSSKLYGGQENPLNQADIAVINRCDGLIHHLQDSTQKYHKLEDSYQKNRKLFYILAIVNLVLIVCVIIFVPLLLFASRKSDSPNENGRSNGVVSDNSKESAKQYNVCFNCSELGRGSTFSLETLVEVSQINGKCCFKSILSVLKSQNWNFQNALDESTNRVKSRISEIDRRLLQLEIGSAPDTNAIIGNILQTLAPKEKTALYLKSPRGTSFGKDYDSYNKLRWTADDSSAILRGGVELDGDGLNIKVKSEAYYFIYTKIQFRHKERAAYNQALPLSYLIYRKRGSISTYVHEAKLNCIFNDMTQEHSSTSEMVLHLNREDEIFISVDDSDEDFLSTDSGDHMIGLFEI